MSIRLPQRPGEQIDRSTPIEFSWNGKQVSGLAGDTIASALVANGTRIFSRSLKYRRPRGLLTADFWDPNCIVQVGHEPNVRAGHRLVEAGMKVTSQNVWPTLKYDARSMVGIFDKFLTAGFYYKTFMAPARLWPVYEKILARFAPGGVVALDTPHGYYDKRYAHPDVVVAGGGPAGMAAAIAAAEAGSSVMLVEHEHQLGGHLRWGNQADLNALSELRKKVGQSDNIEVLTNSTVTGRYEDNWVAIAQRNHPTAVERLVKARAKTLVVAPGLIERPYVFAGNDRPGVMLSGAVRRLIALYAIRPGERAVVFTANADGDAAAADLAEAGVEVVRIVDARKGETVVATEGSPQRLKRVVLSDGSEIAADLLVVAAGWTAPTSLLNMTGDRPEYDPSAARFFASSPPDSVLVTGGLAGDGTLSQLIEHATQTGRLAAARAASVGHAIQRATARATTPGSQPDYPSDDRQPLDRYEHPALFRATTHGIVDFSNDVSSKDLFAAAAEGYDSVELIKRFTTATMGSEQGKLETVNTVAVLAEARGETIAEVGTTVWRPPYAPIALGALAGRIFEPVRLSPLHQWHETNGATPIVAGQWIRPEHYGDPAREVQNVRSNVGIIDVTPLGKLDLQGTDVPKLLNLLYTNKWSQLKVGSVRYGIMCAEDGIVMDDGVTGHLADDHYLMTTTSSGAATVWEWAENWRQTEHPQWDVHITPVTTAYTSINVAGPKSRELVRRLTSNTGEGSIDVIPDAFAYMQVRQGTVAGVPNCIMWRIGFTGELSYELHVPAGYGLHVWEQLLEAGSDLGVAPFGLEAQRIMRLEKGHFIVGQDTDALTPALSTGLRGLIKPDKEDFAGKPEIEWTIDRKDANIEDTAPVLVAIQPTDPDITPAEASQIVRKGTNNIVGRITSSRMSPTLGRSICLGQVEPELAATGTELTVVLSDGSRTTAVVMRDHAHYDPQGERVRG